MSAALASLNEQPCADVYRGICQVAKALSREGISKGSRNQQQGYAFRGIDDIYNSLSALLAGADLCILPRMLSRSQEERATAKGGVLFYVTVQADFDFVSARDGSKHTVTMYGEAMDSADKATNKAMSAAYKYACLQVFCIPTEGMANDSDANTPEPLPRPTPAQAVAQAKITEMRKPAQPQAAVDAIESLPEYDFLEPEAPEEDDSTVLEDELRKSIIEVEQMKRQDGPGPSYFDMLKAFAQLKARYAAIKYERTYYAILGIHGVRHSNEFARTADGLSAARCAYKEMSIDVSNREVKAASRVR